MNPYCFSILFFGISHFILGLLVWFKRQDAVGQLYFIYSLFVSCWALPFSMVINDSTSFPTAYFYAKICNAGALWIGPVWYHFCSLYSGTSWKFSRRIMMGIFYGMAAVIMITVHTSLFVRGVSSFMGFRHYPLPGPFYLIYMSLFLSSVFAGFVEFILQLSSRETFRSEKNQTFYLTIASSLGFVGGALTFLPIYRIPLPQYGMFFMPFYPFIVSYLIARLGLFDLEDLAKAAHRNKLEVLGILSASIQHELKNPLAVIQTRAETFLLEASDPSDEDPVLALARAREGFQSVADQAERALSMMKRITSFSRQRLEDQPKHEKVRAADVLEQLYRLAASELVRQEVGFVPEIKPGAEEITTDVGYLEEILFNLVVNAIQAIKGVGRKNGEVRVVFEIQEDRLRIRVEDNGPGISKDEQSRIFKPFHTTRKEGTGLGLYITSQLAEKIGARLSVHSALGRGTVFIIHFKISNARG